MFVLLAEVAIMAGPQGEGGGEGAHSAVPKLSPCASTTSPVPANLTPVGSITVLGSRHSPGNVQCKHYCTYSTVSPRAVQGIRTFLKEQTRERNKISFTSYQLILEKSIFDISHLPLSHQKKISRKTKKKKWTNASNKVQWTNLLQKGQRKERLRRNTNLKRKGQKAPKSRKKQN